MRAARRTRCHPGCSHCMRLSPYAPRLPPHVPRLPLHVSRRALRNELGRAGTERRVLAAELGCLDETWEGISREGLRASFARLAVDAEAQAAAAAQAARVGTGGALSGWGGAEAEVERRCAARGDTAATLCAQAAIPCIRAATLCARGCNPMCLDWAATPWRPGAP